VGSRYKPYLLVAPLLVFLAATFVYSLGYGVLQSLSVEAGTNGGGLTLRYYYVVLTDHDFSVSLLATLSVALVATLISNIAGAALSFAMLRAKLEGKWLQRVLLLPVVMPHLIVAVIVFHIFAQTGILARLAWWMGFIDNPNAFPLLVFDPWAIGIVLVYLYKQIPFVAMITYNTLSGISHRFSETAANLGANTWQISTQVYLPLLKPTLITTTLITFAFAFGSFEIPFLLGTPAWRMLPVESYVLYTNIDPDARTKAMVINVLISAISLALAVLYNRALHLDSHHRNGGGV
jgi:putative spermidine/putrescine transport system permease protein